jgi:hypothetical protein
MYTRNPAWREAEEDETPGQLEPQLKNQMNIINVIDTDTNTTFCGGGIMGDKAITLEQARDQNNEMYFDCVECYKVLTKEVPTN